ncbi:MAG TPA: amino acid adenylation domain-containing protein, partial [Thermoanaerobaculia bacterium]|nr:amino acid adenylation domain-containing protein [Thermoanaerobaculia bacterium]
RPPLLSDRGASLALRLGPETVGRLRELGRSQGTTLFTVLLTAFQTLLHRHSGQLDVLVGSPAAGRAHRRFADLVGYLVQPVVLRADFTGDPSATDLLRRTRQSVAGALEHQDYPFPLLVERLQPERQAGRSPLFQAMFVLYPGQPAGGRLAGLAAAVLGEEGARLDVGGLELESLSLGESRVQLDLTLAMAEISETGEDGENGGGLLASFQYSRDLFDASSIALMGGHLEALLAGLSEDAGRPVGDLPLLTLAERRQLLAWNAPAETAPDACLHQLFEAQATRTPEAEALVAGGERLTYGELDRRAGRLAQRLRAQGVGPESVVGVYLERSAGLVTALLAVLKAGGAYLPLDPAYPGERLGLLLEDAGAAVLVTREPLLQRLPRHPGRVVLVEGGEPAAGSEPGAIDPGSARAVLPGDLAYLIYTSGSTGHPKGVAIAHRNAVALVRWARRTFEERELAGVLASTSAAFDLSVFELFVPLANGGRVILAANALELASLAAASEVTLVNTVPSAIAELVELRALASGELTVNLAGEALTPDLVRRLHGQPAVRRLLNLYGPSETTTYSTFAVLPHGEEGIPPIGHPVAGTRVYLLDAGLRPVPSGAAGEVYIGGDGVSRGYHARPALTAERFVPDPFSPVPGERLYRTGDLARRRPDGSLVYLGRIDDQVKIRGFRVEPGEVQAALAAHPEVREAVVLALAGAGGERRLTAWVVPSGGAAPSTADLRRYLRERLPDSMVPADFVFLASLPLTINGKVDRRALAVMSTGLPAAGRPESAGGPRDPRDPITEVLAGLWADLLRAERVGIHDGFFELGGHSLLAARVVARVREAFGVELPLSWVFAQPTVAELAAEVRRVRDAGIAGEAPLLLLEQRSEPRPAEIPLSFAQERLWFLDRLVPGQAVYNIPVAARLRGRLDPALLQRALDGLLARHESLRTVFADGSTGPVQRVLPAAPFPLEMADLELDTEPEDEAWRRAAAEVRRPFDLATGPVVRGLLLRLAPEDHLLVLTLHHIAADGWSIGVLFRDLEALYRPAGEEPALPPLPVQYADYALWQRGWLTGEALDRRLGWWREALAGAPEALELPADRPRPPAPSWRGTAVPFALPAPTVARLREVARRQDATLFMAVLAGFGALLSRLSGQTDGVAGTMMANRDRSELDGVAGFFVNALPLRLRLNGAPGLGALLGPTREMALGAFDHGDLPFERLVEALAPRRASSQDGSRGALFQVCLSFEETPARAPRLPGLAVELAPLHTGTSRFDLTLLLESDGGGLSGGAEASADLFDTATVERMLHHLSTLLGGAAADPERPLDDLPLLSPAERRQAIVEWNRPAYEVPAGAAEATLTGLFAAAAARSPEAVAVTGDGGDGHHLTYAGLDRAANRLAHRLRRLGVGPETRVALFVERSPELVVGLLGILKAGGAYVPVDPEVAGERLAPILADSRPRALVTQGSLAHRLPALDDGPVIVRVDDPGLAQGDQGDDAAPADLTAPSHAAYVIYTSGSTGRPKGVVVEHGQVARLLAATDGFFGFGPGDVWSLFHSIAFDFSVWEVWGAMARGGRLVVVPYWTSRSPAELSALIAAEGVTVLNQTPSAFRQLFHAEGQSLAAPRPPLRWVIFGGEALEPAALAPWFERHGDVRPRLVNMYGITETTVHVTFRPLSRDDAGTGGRPAPSLLGRPIPDLRIYVLDPRGEPVPLLAAGEIHVGGAGVARGYLEQPALTAEAFVPDPFSGRSGARLYRSGDLARRLPGGDLEYLGRRDHQVKIRGFRIELAEIEAALAAVPGVREAVVVARGEGLEAEPGDRRLVAYVVGDVAAGELSRSLRERLPGYMVPATFVPLPALPLTPNGKVDRKALPAPERQGPKGGHVAPRTPAEEILAGIWAETLGLERVGVADDFFGLGGHSLLATRVMSRLREAFDVEMPLRDLFEAPRLEDFAARVEAARWSGVGRVLPPLVPRAPELRGEPLPLSFAQQRLWLIDQLEPGRPLYNIAVALRAEGPLDGGVLARCLGEIVRRHEALRTVFTGLDGSPVQVIEPAAPFTLPVDDLSGLPVSQREATALARVGEEAGRPFDLTLSPMLRGLLLRLGPEDQIVALTLHHIAGDGWSMGILVRELTALYAAFAEGGPSPLPELPVQYADFSVWQRSWLDGEALESEVAYWRRQLTGLPPRLELPTDR